VRGQGKDCILPAVWGKGLYVPFDRGIRYVYRGDVVSSTRVNLDLSYLISRQRVVSFARALPTPTTNSLLIMGKGLQSRIVFLGKHPFINVQLLITIDNYLLLNDRSASGR